MNHSISAGGSNSNSGVCLLGRAIESRPGLRSALRISIRGISN